MDQIGLYQKGVFELLRVNISKIGVHLHVPESMSGVQKVNFPDWGFSVILVMTGKEIKIF
jgi:hypothetical protein